MNLLMRFGVAALIGICLPPAADARQNLEDAFFSPDKEARPMVWWRWMSSQVSKEGISADLQALHDAGLGGVVHFQCASGINESNLWNADNCAIPKIKTLSPEWWEMLEYSIAEADRLGLQFKFQNCLGYSTNGGPWITPDLAMQRLVWADTTVTATADKAIKLRLPEPPKHAPSGYYRDIAVVAVKLNEDGVTRLADVHDISSSMDSEGVLSWRVPLPGKWKIIRYGHTPTGVMPHPVDSYANGLECDKMSRAALEVHFNNYVKRIIDNAGEHRDAVKAVMLDSYEAGAQTWTPLFREKFKERCGYDPVLWLPCLKNGSIRTSGNSSLGWLNELGDLLIESKELSERFRYDYLQTIEELVLEENIAAITSLTHQYPGIKFDLQPYNAPYNFVRGGMLADNVSGEFWHNQPSYGWWTLPIAASAAHLTGNPVVIAEAFTATPSSGNWDVLPCDMKAEADLAFSKGITALQLHVMPHQPWPDSIFPGMVSQSWGTQINRHNPYWLKSKAWNDYLTRTQSMLQRGECVVDIAYLYPSFQKGIPEYEGYKVDAVDWHTLMKMDADSSGLFLPSGRRYRLLVLPDSETMEPQLLQKIHELVGKGAVIVGNGPKYSPGLKGYPECDSIVAALSEMLWSPGFKGKGRVCAGRRVEELLAELNVPKDLSADSAIVWTHRREGNTDIYFIAYQKDDFKEAEIEFRIDGKLPEIWDAEHRTIAAAGQWQMADGCTTVNLNLEPHQSLFVVFRTPTAETRRESAKSSSATELTIPGPWQLSLKPAVGKTGFELQTSDICNLAQSEDERVKYFSGTVVYSAKVKLAEKQLKQNSEILLSLDSVGGIAAVRINGKDAGILWKRPYRSTNIKPLLHKGINDIEIEVSTTLANLMIGDEQKSPDVKVAPDHEFNRVTEYPEWLVSGTPRPSSRATFATYNYYSPSSPLRSSGLLSVPHITFIKSTQE